MEDGSLLQHHVSAWICMGTGILQPSLLVLFRLLRTEVAADRFLNYHFFLHTPTVARAVVAMLQPHSGISAHGGLFLCLPGAVTFSLLVVAHGKFTHSRWYEVRPWNELVTCSPMHTYLVNSTCLCVTVCLLPVKSFCTPWVCAFLATFHICKSLER